jgi:hypothetical protein
MCYKTLSRRCYFPEMALRVGVHWASTRSLVYEYEPASSRGIKKGQGGLLSWPMLHSNNYVSSRQLPTTVHK